MTHNQRHGMSKGILILLALVLVMAGTLTSPYYGQDGKVFAAAEDDFEYEIRNGSYGNGAYIDDYNGDETKVVKIPATLGGSPVVSVQLLYCDIEAIDTSACTSLQYLSVYGNKLNYLDVSNNTALRSLDCSENNLRSLDLKQNPSLTHLDCGFNRLTSLDVSKNTGLTSLLCGSNKLSALDVKANVRLDSLWCGSNKLKTLDVSENVALTSLNIFSNTLTSIDVNKNLALEELYCYDNELASLDVSALKNLIELSCSNNLLKTLTLSVHPYLESLYCENNLLKDLNVSQLSQLGRNRFSCVNNRITNSDTLQTLIARFGRYDVMPQREENDLTVVGGTGSGEYRPGNVINIKADPAPEGKVFGRWTTDTAGAIAEAGLTSAETSFTMPAADATVTATWKTLLSAKEIGLTVDGKAQTGQKIVVADKQWSGKQINPSVVVKAGGTVLKAGVDYTLSFANNVAIGNATATITGTGAYTGTKTFTFRILPKKLAVTKVTAAAGAIKVNWKKAATAQKITKIQLRYRLKGAKKWTTKTLAAKTATVTIKNLRKGKVYQFQLGSYKKVGKAKYSGVWSAIKTSKPVK